MLQTPMTNTKPGVTTLENTASGSQIASAGQDDRFAQRAMKVVTDAVQRNEGETQTGTSQFDVYQQPVSGVYDQHVQDQRVSEFFPSYAMRAEQAQNRQIFDAQIAPNELGGTKQVYQHVKTGSPGIDIAHKSEDRSILNSSNGAMSSVTIDGATGLPLSVMEFVKDEHVAHRRDKLSAIGTLLEKAVIADPYIAPNSRQCIPKVFVNRKLYGQSTADDPVNNIALVKQARNSSTMINGNT